ncbi:hypothetical protein [Pseudothauera rhizosphaerae]|uniref:Uncharacterized protein n=1 Tax=Pseudothauera rhizosphaerae TaxID=2565932 RepID=A0A4S4AAL0_9RHOO|nr:hypothetical protein [Pseudothauera rhizosphaerae]THF55919.1 hypothetical protein E6O51_20245 [Pseudothauera rhizosphaerae]
MRDKNLDLNTSSPLPSSDGGISGGSYGALGGASVADLKRGYTAAGMPEEAGDLYSMFETEKESGGFCGRPHGWER